MIILVVFDLLCWLAFIGGMYESLLLAIPLTVGIVMYMANEMKYSNYTPPTGCRVDYGKANLDAALYHLSEGEIKRNMVQGKYNVPIK